MYRQKIIKCPLYTTRVCFVVTDEVKELHKRHPHIEELELEDPLFGHTIRTGIVIPNEEEMARCVFIVLNPNYKFGEFKFTAGCIAHECLHATNTILSHVGIKADYDNDEAQAYLMGYLTDQITEFIKPYWKDGK